MKKKQNDNEICITYKVMRKGAKKKSDTQHWLVFRRAETGERGDGHIYFWIIYLFI